MRRDCLIDGADAGGGPQVSVFNGNSHALITSFFAFAPTFTGGVRVGAGDVNGDGKMEIATATGSGVPGEVKVLSWPNLIPLKDFNPFTMAFADGVFVAGPAPGDVIFRDGFEP